jgi:hypothetical protein
LETGVALPASLVIEHVGCNSWTAVEAPSYADDLGKRTNFIAILLSSIGLLNWVSDTAIYTAAPKTLGMITRINMALSSKLLAFAYQHSPCHLSVYFTI